MIVLGIDAATRTGWAVRDSDRHRSTIQCGTFTVQGYEWEEKYAIAANLFYRLIKDHKPDFVAIEKPEHGVRQFAKKGKPDLTGEERTVSTINPAALQLTGIVGAIIAICQIKAIPYGTIAATSWRPIYFGKGVKPQAGKDWKDMAIEIAQQEQIVLPPTKAEQRDAAEAIGICTCWHKTDVPGIKWMQDKFVELRTGAYDAKRKAAA